ncbi:MULTISPECIES: hypothetical protein [unclassified Microcoleus]
MYVDRGTVRVHVHAILQKLEVAIALKQQCLLLRKNW